MAARLLRHYFVGPMVGGNVDSVVAAAPAAIGGVARALAVSRITVTAANGALVFSVRVGAGYIAEKISLAIGEQWEGGGYVQLAGETIGYSCDVAAAGSIAVFGEEVDNQ